VVQPVFPGRSTACSIAQREFGVESATVFAATGVSFTTPRRGNRFDSRLPTGIAERLRPSARTLAQLLHSYSSTHVKTGSTSMNKLISTLFLLTCLAACEQEGPAERAGERIDDAADRVADAARDVRDEAEEVADEVAERAERARE
jgi:hypothetical protein